MNAPKKLWKVLTATSMSIALLGAAGCAGDDLSSDEAESSAKGKVVLTGQSFTESALMASMYEQLLINAGYSVEKKLVTSRDIYMKDQFPDKVDVAPEYVGGVLDYLSTVNDPDAETITTSDLDETLTAGEQLMKEKGIAFLNPAEATDTNAFFVTQEYAEDNDVSKLSDLRGKKITLAGHADCEARLDCAKGLEKVYGIKLKEVLPLGFASDQTYQSVADGESQLGLTSTTDGTLEEQGFVLLEDDKSVQPVQNLVPVVSQKFLDDHTDVVDALNPLMDKLTTDDLTELNRRVGVEREKVEDVAQDYLTEQSLLG